MTKIEKVRDALQYAIEQLSDCHLDTNYLRETLENIKDEKFLSDIKIEKLGEQDLSHKALEYIDDYLDMGCFKNPELVRPSMLEGYIFGFRESENFYIKKYEDSSKLKPACNSECGLRAVFPISCSNSDCQYISNKLDSILSENIFDIIQLWALQHSGKYESAHDAHKDLARRINEYLIDNN